MLDRIRDIDPAAVDLGLVQGAFQQAARWPDERLTLQVLLVARLLADQHHPGVLGALAEHGLGGLTPQVTGLAGGRGLLQLLDAVGLRRGLGHSLITHEFDSNWE